MSCWSLSFFYGLALTLLPTCPPRSLLSSTFLMLWPGVSLLLRAQSKHKFLVRHYLKKYHYSKDEAPSLKFLQTGKQLTTLGDVHDKVGQIDSEMNFFFIYWVQCMIVRRTMSSKLILYLYPLIGLHIWATMESYEFLGLFGGLVRHR